MDKILTSRQGPWIAGGFIGLIAVALAHFGASLVSLVILRVL